MSLSHRVTELLERWFKTQSPSTLKTSSISHNVTITDSVGGTIIAQANENRHRLIIQNNGIYPVLISIGDSISISDYNFVISASSENRLGDGGSFIFESWKGQVRGITESSSSNISVLEEVT